MDTWRTCKTHGDEKPNVYGCADCIREMRLTIEAERRCNESLRKERDAFAAKLRSAVAVVGNGMACRDYHEFLDWVISTCNWLTTHTQQTTAPVVDDEAEQLKQDVQGQEAMIEELKSTINRYDDANRIIEERNRELTQAIRDNKKVVTFEEALEVVNGCLQEKMSAYVFPDPDAEQWEKTTIRRGQLIQKKVQKSILPEEQSELDHLQRIADERIRHCAPLPLDQLEKIRDDLQRKGMWENPDPEAEAEQAKDEEEKVEQLLLDHVED